MFKSVLQIGHFFSNILTNGCYTVLFDYVRAYTNTQNVFSFPVSGISIFVFTKSKKQQKKKTKNKTKQNKKKKKQKKKEKEKKRQAKVIKL